jgi:hypothetical protein
MGVILDVLGFFNGSMSTRQVYYQCVSRGAVPNSESGYDRIQRILVNMRRDGVVPYDRIVDRTRAKHQLAGWDGAQAIVDAGARQYRRNLWAEQDTIVMIACEKQALEGIFAEAVDEYGASLWTVHGFTSLSFAYEWAEEIKAHTSKGKNVVVAYFGDHDPSGLCLEQKIIDELLGHGAEFDWRREGLLWEDFEKFDLINIPLKLGNTKKKGDSRALGYLEKYGNKAAELDALPPDELRRRIAGVITEYIDVDPWNRLADTAAVERESLAMVAKHWNVALTAAQGAA